MGSADGSVDVLPDWTTMGDWLAHLCGTPTTTIPVWLKDNLYAFAGSVAEVVTWVLTTGPVITGTNWYSGMMLPDATGRVKISGEKVGGHEWTINGADTDKQLFYCVNSWGTGWGQGGHFAISFDDHARLLAEYGDACVTAEVGAEPPPVGNRRTRLTFGDEVLFDEAI